MDNIIFIGTNTFAAEILEQIINEKIKLSAIFTKNASKQGRGKKETPHPVESIAKKYNKLFHTTSNINNEEELIKKYNPNIIIIIDHGTILDENILKIPKFGCINLHPSILPKLRGSSPIQYAILNGCKKTGVSVIKINNKIDAGNILKIKRCKILDTDNYITLSKKLNKLGFISLKETINEIEYNKINTVIQNEKYTSYAPKLEKNSFKINWNDLAININRKTRALLIGNKSAYTYIEKKYVKILYTTIIKSKIKENIDYGTILNIDKSGIYVYTKKNLIKIEKLQVENKNITTVKNLINSNNNLFIKGNKFT